jgi:hypothetical protein
MDRIFRRTNVGVYRHNLVQPFNTSLAGALFQKFCDDSINLAGVSHANQKISSPILETNTISRTQRHWPVQQTSVLMLQTHFPSAVPGASNPEANDQHHGFAAN